MILYGRKAVEAVEQREGRTLSYGERRVVMLEGYATEIYHDTKNVPTSGVGQTGQWLHSTFKAAFSHHIDRVRQRLPDFDSYPEYLRGELVQAEYRGDLGLSPKAVSKVRSGFWEEAATEFLNNKEYKAPATSRGIKRRMEAMAAALVLRSKQEW